MAGRFPLPGEWSGRRVAQRPGPLDLHGVPAADSVTAGTVFADTRSPLRTWFVAAWYVTGQKQGVSALGLQRVLGFGSYETAWSWLHKLRRAMVRPGRDQLFGEVEIDETYVGGPEPWAFDRRTTSKSIVAIAIERRGRTRLGRVEDGPRPQAVDSDHDRLPSRPWSNKALRYGPTASPATGAWPPLAARIRPSL